MTGSASTDSLGQEEFGRLLQSLRIAAGFTQTALAQRARISEATVSALERGLHQRPYKDTVERLAVALELNDDDRLRLHAAAMHASAPRVRRRNDAPRDESNVVTDESIPAPFRLIGRETALAEVRGLLANARAVSLVGPGGIGKTSIALHIAATARNVFSESVWFIDLSPLSTSENMLRSIAQTAGITVDDDRVFVSLIEALKKCRAFIVLDNCEHLIDPVRQFVTAILTDCRNIQILATTRRYLRTSNEVAYTVSSLAFPKSSEASRASDAKHYSAVALFVERAVAANPRFRLTDDNVSDVIAICSRLDGIPLAIELAAARSNVLTAQQLREHLVMRFRLLIDRRGGKLPRHRTLAAVIDWSFHLLTLREQEVMRRLSIFAGGFSLDAATAVADDSADVYDVLDVISTLCDNSLLVTDHAIETTRYRMAESTRVYATQKLELAGERAICGRRRLRFLRDAFVMTRKQVQTNGRVAALQDLLVAERDDVRAALDEVRADTGLHDSADLLSAIDFVWYLVGLGREGYAHLKHVLNLLPRHETARRSRLLTVSACIAVGSGMYTHIDTALDVATQALSSARDVLEGDGLAYALLPYGEALSKARRFEEAVAILHEADACNVGTDVWLRLRILKAKIQVEYFSGNLEAAAQSQQMMRRLTRQLGDAAAASIGAINYAEIEHQLGHTAAAASALMDVLPDLRNVHDQHSILNALANLCGYFVALDRLEEVETAARELFERCRDHDRAGTFAIDAVEHCACAIALSGDIRRAAVLAGYTDEAFRRIGYTREYTELRTRKRLEAVLRENLAPEVLESDLRTGSHLLPDEAITLALSQA